MDFSKVWSYIVARVKEPSTWAGVAAAAGAVSLGLQSHMTLGAIIVAAAAAVFMPEQSKKA